jgi:hypothetical protein
MRRVKPCLDISPSFTRTLVALVARCAAPSLGPLCVARLFLSLYLGPSVLYMPAVPIPTPRTRIRRTALESVPFRPWRPGALDDHRSLILLSCNWTSRAFTELTDLRIRGTLKHCTNVSTSQASHLRPGCPPPHPHPSSIVAVTACYSPMPVNTANSHRHNCPAPALLLLCTWTHHTQETGNENMHTQPANDQDQTKDTLTCVVVSLSFTNTALRRKMSATCNSGTVNS